MLKLKSILLSLLGLLPASGLLAQQDRPLTVALIANATSLPTRPGEIFQSVHPGIMLGTSFRYNKDPKNQLAQTLKIGYIYHQFVHHSVPIFSELEYKRIIGSQFSISGAIGVGYVHLFPATEVFERNDQGEYVKKPAWGRPQLMVSTALGLGYLLNPGGEKPMEIFTRYQFSIQGPFVRQYVPLLPNTALHLGLSYPLF